MRSTTSSSARGSTWLREPDPDAVASPPLLMAFDLLYCEGRDLTARPLRDRLARLEDIVAGSELVFLVRRLVHDGPEAGTLTAGNGLAHLDEHGSCRRSI